MRRILDANQARHDPTRPSLLIVQAEHDKIISWTSSRNSPTTTGRWSFGHLPEGPLQRTLAAAPNVCVHGAAVAS